MARAGTGTVTSAPGGITCGADCSEQYLEGVTVTLTATPAAGGTFTGWSGACPGVAPTCTVTMSAARAAKASFTTVPTFKLTVRTAGSGTPGVTRDVPGVPCGAGCASYTSGTVVVLAPDPGPLTEFTGWTGCDAVVELACAMTMTASRTVTATFRSTAQVASITVTPGSASLLPAFGQRLAAVARDPAGAAIPGVVFTWTSSNPSVAAVDATGSVTAIAPGTATVQASVGSITSNPVTVVVTAVGTGP